MASKGLPPRVQVTIPAGATMAAATLGTQSVTGTALTSTLYQFDMPSLGPWTFSCSVGGKTASSVVEVDDVALYEKKLSFVSATLNDNDWATISEVSQAGEGANYWSVGDCKGVTLNGTVGQYTFSSYTVYAFIIGFNHNSGYEGGNRIHFQFAKTALSGGTDVCFVDSAYGDTGSTAAFRMNTTNTNSGGWSSSYMRQTICGTSLSSYSGTFIAALPAALRSVLKTVTKYTDNTGGCQDTASCVTATTDVIFLLAEFEVFGTRTYANSAEKNKQAQYAYYSAGNSKVKYKHNATSTAAYWWLRSPGSSNATDFVVVSASGSVNGYGAAGGSLGFAPGFCV